MTRPIATGMTQVEFVRLLRNLCNKFYPWSRILLKANGSVVFTIHPTPPGEGPQR